MKVRYLLLISFLIVGALLVPAVSAVNVEPFRVDIDDRTVNQMNYVLGESGTKVESVMSIRLYDGASVLPGDGNTLIWFGRVENNNQTIHANHTALELRIDSTTYATGTFGYYRDAQGVGYVYADYVWILQPPAGAQRFQMYHPSGSRACIEADRVRISGVKATTELNLSNPAGFGDSSTGDVTTRSFSGQYTYNTVITFRHSIRADEQIPNEVDLIQVLRNIDGRAYESRVILSGKSGVYLDTTDTADISYVLGASDRPYTVTIYNDYQWYNYTIFDVDPTQPVEFRPFDINGNVPLNDVQIAVYTCDPVTFEPGTVVDIFTVDYGDIKSLPRGYYCVAASLNNYEQVYPISETRFSNLNGPAVALIPMEREVVIDPTQPTLRTGSVTMTDHNGTSISGFEVTAVNYYTGESHTVSTDTDVAVITLPMDRTVEIRNPQTGAYEEAPVGYYTFYGQKPGYKMLLEEGIKVSVLPEKYDSYKLCNILVTSDTGPLTGKHQFQLRSWSDNSILQTGTLSAKSATTGIWYNTTVTNGIATLILPYDTSDALSEHAGQYYFYATSPGYEDIDYGVQITVYPREIYEVKSIHLYPIGGVPPPGNVTLRIQVISETGQAVPNAEIFIAGVHGEGKDVRDTYTTSWTGFLEVSVPDNSIYDIVARADGYHDSSQRIDLFIQDPTIIEMRLYLSGVPTVEPTTEPTGWVTGPPTTQPTGGIPDEDDGSGGLLMEAVRGIGNAFGVGFATAKIILGMLLALAIGFATAKQLRGGAAEFGLGLLGGTMLGILIGLIPVWTIVVLLLVVGLYIGNRYVGGANNG